MDMPHYESQRRDMVERQIANRGVKDVAVLAAMERVPRHEFVPPEAAASAYDDHPVQIGCGQTISQPYMVAYMTELLELQSTDRVLEIGAGSGYQTAVLCELAAEVFSVERHPRLAEKARERLESLGYHNCAVICGDGTRGVPEHAPFDAILVTAGGPVVPQALLDQLAVGGRLVAPIGDRKVQRLLRVRRTEDGLKYEEDLECVFVPLVGEEGWPEGTT